MRILLSMHVISASSAALVVCLQDGGAAYLGLSLTFSNIFFSNDYFC